MDEHAARDAPPVRAVEGADAEHKLITEADGSTRRAPPVNWRAGRPASAASRRRTNCSSSSGPSCSPASCASASAASRRRPVHSAWRPWIGVVLPVAAFAFGAYVQQVSDRQHINVLAFPLLTIVLWNLVVYALLGVHLVSGLGRGPRRLTGLRRAVTALAQRGRARVRGGAGTAYTAFIDEWSRANAPLLAARAARVLHLSAALLALGAIVGLYVRGLVFEYRAGWESTFLEPAQVHALLSVLLGPAASALGMPFPGVSELASMRWPGSIGENAARWIHWIALTVAVLVVVPRLVLAAVARWKERRLSHRFPIALDEPYFRRLLSGFSPYRTQLRVLPYSYTIDEASLHGLRDAAVALLGDATELAFRTAVPFGAERSATAGIDPTDRSVALSVALFNLASTPEHENHGAFLDALRPVAGPRLIALVDEAAYKRRLGGRAGRARSNGRAPRRMGGVRCGPRRGHGIRGPDRAGSRATGTRRRAGARRRPMTSAASTVEIALVSHTNAGKTTLARTLLGRDIGEVRDAPHVTDLTESHTLLTSPEGDTLRLADTPGFGDSARLVQRLRAADNPLGWLLREVWTATATARSGAASRPFAPRATAPMSCCTWSTRPRIRATPATWHSRCRCCAGWTSR